MSKQPHCDINDLSSDFDSGSVADDLEDRRKAEAEEQSLFSKAKKPQVAAKPAKSDYGSQRDRVEGGQFWRQTYQSLNAYDKHKLLINQYLLYEPGAAASLKRDTSRDRTDIDVIRENQRFLWDEETETANTWGEKLAKKYYDKLFREYCITDLRFYKENKIALRWRVQKEVVDGKGQFVCGEKHCSVAVGLLSWEVNFGYVENGVKRNALVKVRLCPECSKKLNYHHKRPEAKKRRKTEDEEETEQFAKRSKGAPGETPEGGEHPQPSAGVTAPGESESTIWSKPVEVEEEKAREDEFEEFLEDLFL